MNFNLYVTFYCGCADDLWGDLAGAVGGTLAVVITANQMTLHADINSTAWRKQLD